MMLAGNTDNDPFASLRNNPIDDLLIVAQIGQSLDGRSATANGLSHYINGDAGLDHLHGLRARMDAVVVGIGTVMADNPQLTVRRVAGQNPARVVIDPSGRLPATARLLAQDGTPRLVLTADGAHTGHLPHGVEAIRLPVVCGQMSPSAIVAALAARGLRRVLIEGGARTVSGFLAARCLDRIHVVVAPVILGSGRFALHLPEISHLSDALRPPTRIFPLGAEVLFDCDFSSYRARIGVAKKST